jgi:hypothetical protein
MPDLPLHNSRKRVRVSAADLPRLRQGSWGLHPKGYVRGTLDGEPVYLHRLVCHTTKARNRVWFLDGDKLNCTRGNLIAVSPAEFNALCRRNPPPSGYHGVYRNYSYRYRSLIQVNKQKISLGFFDSPTQAARAYDAARRYHFGEQSRVNFPRENAAQPAARLARANRRRIKKTPHPGVTLERDRYKAQVWHEGRVFNLGRHDLVRDAVAAVREFRREHV